MRHLIVAVGLSAVLIGVALFVIFGVGGKERPLVKGPVGPDTPLDQRTPQKGPGAEKIFTPGPKAKVKVEVHVVDEQGKDVPLARVKIECSAGGDTSSGRYETVATLTTNRSGLAVKDELEEGYYRFTASAEGYPSATRSQAIAATAEKVQRVKLDLYSGLTISGRVLTEKGGKPIPDARVVAHKELGNKDSDELEKLLDLINQQELKTVLAEAKTDREGKYVLTGLQKGVACALRATAQGYATGEKDYVETGSRNVDFRLGSGPSLGGRVVSSEGSPVGDATVEAYAQTGQGGVDLFKSIVIHMRGAIDSVKTDRDGRFNFTTLGQGTFVLLAEAPGYQSATQENIRVRAGANEEITLKLEPGLHLTGKVVGPDGAPVAGAKIEARPQAVVSRPSSVSKETDREATTDAQGVFGFDSLGRGAHMLTVSHPDLAPTQLRDVEVPSENIAITLTYGAFVQGRVTDDAGKSVPGARISTQDLAQVSREAVTDQDGVYQLGPLSVKPNRKKHLMVEAEGYARPESSTGIDVQEGKVVEKDFVLSRSSTIAGIVCDSQKQPVENAKVMVEIMVTPDNPVQRFSGVARTGEDGRFELDSVSPSQTVRLMVQHRFYLPWESDPFQVDPGEAIKDVEVELQQGAKINGIVLNEEGKPVTEARVLAVLPGDPDPRDPFGGSTGTTDTTGAFTLRGLRAGKYEIVAQARGYLEGRSEPVDIADGAALSGMTIKIGKAQKLAGTAKTSDGNPVANARLTAIEVAGSTRRLSGVSKEDGSWEIEGLGSESVELTAEADGFAEVVLKDVRPGATDVAVEFAPLGGVRGRVVDKDGQPVKAFSVKPEPVSTDESYPRPRAARFKTFSNPDGSFEFNDLTPGRYTLNVQSPGYKGVQVEAGAVTASDVVDVGTITLLVGGALTGRVVDGSNRPVADTTVTVLGGASRFSVPQGADPQTSVVTGADGRFHFENLKGGSVTLRASKEGFVSTDSTVDPSTLEEEVVMTLETGGAIVGVVVGGDERPMAGVQVFLQGQSTSRSGQIKTDQNGRFEFSQLPGGRYRVRTFTFKKPGDQQTTEANEEVELLSGKTLELVLRRIGS